MNSGAQKGLEATDYLHDECKVESGLTVAAFRTLFERLISSMGY